MKTIEEMAKSRVRGSAKIRTRYLEQLQKITHALKNAVPFGLTVEQLALACGETQMVLRQPLEMLRQERHVTVGPDKRRNAAGRLAFVWRSAHA